MRQPTWPRRKCLSRCCARRIFLRMQAGKYAKRSSDVNVVTWVTSEKHKVTSIACDASSSFVCSYQELSAAISMKIPPKTLYCRAIHPLPPTQKHFLHGGQNVHVDPSSLNTETFWCALKPVAIPRDEAFKLQAKV